MTSDTHAQLELRGITKQYPGTLANDRIDLTVKPGETHALLGENGAGKSTLVKIIYGVVQPDEGDKFWQGKPVEIPNPNAARRLGIGMVFQHFSLFEGLTVSENIALGVPGARDGRALMAEIERVSHAYGLPLDPRRHVHTLSVGERQRIEIVRCLLQSPKLLIMDEPTSVLTPQEVDRLFTTLRQLAAEGCSILYISHKLQEIVELCETATILRQGRVVARCDPRQESPRSMAQMMIGEELAAPVQTAPPAAGGALLKVNNLNLVSRERFGVNLKDISFAVQSGEIMGIAGVAGNGQVELLAALSGETPTHDPGSVEVDGAPLGTYGPRRRRTNGMAFVPEERLGHAAVPAMSLVENALLSAYQSQHLLSGGFIKFQDTRKFAGQVVESFDVRTPGTHAAASSLSGGNLQKFVVGREVEQKPTVLIASQPTWGVDAGAAAAIRQALRDLAAAGAAIVVISQDLDELMEISHRIAVLNLGRLSEPRPVGDVTVEELGLLMGGVHGDDGGDESGGVAATASVSGETAHAD